MRQWLLSNVGAALLSSLALAVCPGGRVRQVTRFACALVCMLALMSPLVKLDLSEYARFAQQYRTQAEQIGQQEQEAARQEQAEYIRQQCAAYILTEAQSIGAQVSGAGVELRWDDEADAWQPASCTVEGAYDPTLSARIESELGIAREAQQWRQ